MAHSKALSLHAVEMMLPLITGIGREGHGKRLRYIASLADSGHLHPLLDGERFTLETAADAHRSLHSGRARARSSLTLSDFKLGANHRSKYRVKNGATKRAKMSKTEFQRLI